MTPRQTKQSEVSTTVDSSVDSLRDHTRQDKALWVATYRLRIASLSRWCAHKNGHTCLCRDFCRCKRSRSDFCSFAHIHLRLQRHFGRFGRHGLELELVRPASKSNVSVALVTCRCALHVLSCPTCPYPVPAPSRLLDHLRHMPAPVPLPPHACPSWRRRERTKLRLSECQQIKD